MKEKKSKQNRALLGKNKIDWLAWYLMVSGVLNGAMVLQAFWQVMWVVSNWQDTGVEVKTQANLTRVSWGDVSVAYVGIGALVGIFLFQVFLGAFMVSRKDKKLIVTRQLRQFGGAMGVFSFAYLLRFLWGWLVMWGVI